MGKDGVNKMIYPSDNSYKEQLIFVLKTMDKDDEDFPFVVSLLSFLFTNGGLTEKQARWANRIIAYQFGVLEEAGLWPPPQKPKTKKMFRKQENVVYLNPKKD
jgi:hypothetical protein